jgi:hypothetical protein
MLENKKCQIKTLGVRLNFLGDDSLKKFFDDVIFSGKVKLRNLYINQNNISTHMTMELHKALKEKEKESKMGLKLFVDKFEKVQYLQEDRLKDTIWFAPVRQSLEDEGFKNRILSDLCPRKVGLMKSQIRIKIGKKLPMKQSQKNQYIFVEFEPPRWGETAGVTKLVKNKRITLSDRAYIAGTNTFVYYRRSKK